MPQNLTQKAIASALKGNWEEALEINSQILKENPADVDSLNRLARAYCELGNFADARKTAKKVLKIDPNNKIALKNLVRWKGLKKGDQYISGETSSSLFLEEPGRTILVNLMNVNSQKAFSKIDSGDKLEFNPVGHRISVTTKDGEYIGKLPDDISNKLKKLIKMGNKYIILAKKVDPKEVKVFIREIETSPKTKGVPSFPTEKINYIPYTPPELVHERNKNPKNIDEEDE